MLGEASGPPCLLPTVADILTPLEAATVLRVGRSTIYHLLKSKQIRSIKIGAKIIVPRRYLEEYLANSASH